MLEKTHMLLSRASHDGYAIGAFNVYNLEGALAVTQAAKELNSPVILQILPSALTIGKTPLVQLCLQAARSVDIPVAVHLDHSSSVKEITTALDSGMQSVMADGSMLDYEDNLEFTKNMVALGDKYSAGIEAELGRITGAEDGISYQDKQAKMTDPTQAVDFAEKTGIHALAVCIGNIHGKYKQPPQLDFDRLSQINKRLSIPLVLHGSSGLPDEMIHTAIANGICKFNVNTEVRSSYIQILNQLFDRNQPPELIEIMNKSIAAMKGTIKEKIQLFGSINKAVQHKK